MNPEALETTTGRVHVVIGATGGIGSALSRRLARGGGSVVVAARDGDRVKALADELGGLGITTDARKLEDVERLLGEARLQFGRVDGLVNCAGSVFLKPAHATSAADWETTLATNLTTAFTTVRAGSRALQPGGSMVLVSSAAARIGVPNHEAIAAAKAGVIGLTLAAAATYAPRGLRINAVAPGLVRTPATEGITGGPSGEASRVMHPLGRLGEPDDVASAIEWLLSPSQSWVTGQVVGVDGGIASVRSRT